MGFFTKLFGAKDKLATPFVVGQMERLANASRMATAMMLMHDLGISKAGSEKEQMQIAVRAGAQACLLFDQPLAPEHGDLDTEAERYFAFTWFDRQSLFKKLIVQTLRVDNTLHYARSGQVPDPIIGKTLLESFGKQFKEEPNPDSYYALLGEAINSMPAELQAKMVAWLQQNK